MEDKMLKKVMSSLVMITMLIVVVDGWSGEMKIENAGRKR
jgi:hypothetical protein